MTPYLLTVCDLSISERSSTHREGRTQHGLADFPARNRVPGVGYLPFGFLPSIYSSKLDLDMRRSEAPSQSSIN